MQFSPTREERYYEAIFTATPTQQQLLTDQTNVLLNIKNLDKDLPNIRTLSAYGSAGMFYLNAGKINTALYDILNPPAGYNPAPLDIFEVEAYHAGRDSSGTEITPEELQQAAFTMSYKPLSINHAHMADRFSNARWLRYPENQCLEFWYDRKAVALRGQIRVKEPATWNAIRNREIKNVSVEFHSFGGSEGKGMVFTGLALLTKEAKASDDRARILERSNYIAKHNPERLPEIARLSLAEHLENAVIQQQRRNRA